MWKEHFVGEAAVIVGIVNSAMAAFFWENGDSSLDNSMNSYYNSEP